MGIAPAADYHAAAHIGPTRATTTALPMSNPFANDNPYASPAPDPAMFAPPIKPGPVTPASTWKRLVNLIVDNIIMQILSAAVGFGVGIVYFLSRGTEQVAISPAEEMQLNIAGYIVGLFVALAYYAGSEYFLQRTPAKFLTGTIVVNLDGGRPTGGQILGRTACRFIPFEVFSFLGDPCVGWHDSIPKTRVVDAR